MSKMCKKSPRLFIAEQKRFSSLQSTVFGHPIFHVAIRNSEVFTHFFSKLFTFQIEIME